MKDQTMPESEGKKLRREADAHMMDEFSAIYIGHYGGVDFFGHVRVYESAGQRFLVEIRDGRWTIYTFHATGGGK